MRKVTYTYRLDEDGGYHGVTSTSPEGFSGALYVGMGPKPHQGPWSVHEQVYSVKQIKQWVAVDLEDVPKEWCDAIGYEEQPEPTPEPALTFVIKDQERLESVQEVFGMLEAGMVPPQPKGFRLPTFNTGNDRLDDPWFIPTFAIIATIFYILVYCI